MGSYKFPGLGGQIMSTASTIRTFFKELFGNSVQDELRRVLERERDTALVIRRDFERRLEEKEQFLTDYKTELALARNKLREYELVLIPLASPIGKQLFTNRAETKPTFDLLDSAPSSSWEKQQAEWYKQQELEAAAERQPAEKKPGEVTQDA